MNHIISIKQYNKRSDLDSLFALAENLQKMKPESYPKPLANHIVATLFYEPSTRTRLSFEAATLRLGGGVISTENAVVSSSFVKGESLEDTIKMVSGYADCIILRHKEPEAAKRASLVSTVPIINAGDGGGEHPTQALLDAYTIVQQKGKIDGLKIALAGDLLYSRTIHSLLLLLLQYKVELYLVSPDSLQIPKTFLEELQKANIPYKKFNKLEDCLIEIDVLYINRTQLERHSSDNVSDSPKLNKGNIGLMKKDAIVLDPLPRVDELDPEIDSDPRALYFQQAKNGLYIRMALLSLIFA